MSGCIEDMLCSANIDGICFFFLFIYIWGQDSSQMDDNVLVTDNGGNLIGLPYISPDDFCLSGELARLLLMRFGPQIETARGMPLFA